MSWAFLENGEIKEVHYFIPRNWRNISNFNILNAIELKSHNWYQIIEEYVEFDSTVQEIYDHELIVIDEGVKRVPLIRDKIFTVQEFPEQKEEINNDSTEITLGDTEVLSSTNESSPSQETIE